VTAAVTASGAKFGMGSGASAADRAREREKAETK
jgi:hypothetical protein